VVATGLGNLSPLAARSTFNGKTFFTFVAMAVAPGASIESAEKNARAATPVPQSANRVRLNIESTFHRPRRLI
jgi:hypothetical protein